MNAWLTMDENETVEKFLKKRCPCGGFLKVVKTPRGRKTEAVCDSCNGRTMV